MQREWKDSLCQMDSRKVFEKTDVVEMVPLSLSVTSHPYFAEESLSVRHLKLTGSILELSNSKSCKVHVFLRDTPTFGDPALVAAAQGLGRHDGRALGRGLRAQGPAAGASGKWDWSE